ncbi:hypothetical protein QUF70_18830, partial [Desulfobacterales bacterium HSG17]|nr:hypothetical protein [Desulfobacterales bacterium HSG17]
MDASPPGINGPALVNPGSLTESETSAAISISQIESENGIGRVWARIYPPFEEYVSPDTPVIVLPTIK